MIKPCTALVLSCLLMSGCQSAYAMAKRPEAASAFGGPPGVKAAPAAAQRAEIAQASVTEAHALLGADPKLVLLDVRTSEEFASGHAPGALNRPLADLAAWSKSLDPSAGYVVICRSGARSMKAAQGLNERGFTQLTNVKGGMLDWEAEGLPVAK